LTFLQPEWTGSLQICRRERMNMPAMHKLNQAHQVIANFEPQSTETE
jgi:hypothetical protein